ncbi:uncharacterized protein F5147DRAFT_659051, partial [Suillus discolor]
MSPVWLYVPAVGEILQLVQLAHEEHPFVSITTGSYVVVGYLANNNQVSPIYCERSFQEAQPWTGRLTQLGWLIAPGERDTTHLHELFTATRYPMPTWLLQELLNASVQFSYAPFPDGYPPPIVTPVQQLMRRRLPPIQVLSITRSKMSSWLLLLLTSHPRSFKSSIVAITLEIVHRYLSQRYRRYSSALLDKVNGLDEVDGVLTKEPALEVFILTCNGESLRVVCGTLEQKATREPHPLNEEDIWWRVMMLTRALLLE